MAITADDLAAGWVHSVERFVEHSPWLNNSHLPQLKALFEIAKRLDMPGDWNAALVSQFTLCQRTLAGKAPGAEELPEGPDTLMGGDVPPPMFDLE